MILVGGEALVDLFVEPEPWAGDGRAPGARRALAVPGGSPYNVAIGLRRLGVESAFLGGLSIDGFGRTLAGELTREGVSLAFAKTSRRLTPLAIVATGADGHPAYSFHADGTAHSDVNAADIPTPLPDRVAAIALGSFSLVHEPVGSSLLGLVEREGGSRVVSLDPNLRAALVGDLAAWRTRFDAFARHATLIKASDEDIRGAFDPAADHAEVAGRWLALGATLVVITLGEAGATAYAAGGRRIEVAARPVATVDTVGAGDTFHAALLAALGRTGRLSRPAVAALRDDAIRELLTEAATAAAITCSRRGADLPNAAELAAALDARVPA